MKTSRRVFLRLGGAAALAGLFTPVGIGGTIRVVEGGLPLGTEEQTLLDFIATYGSRVRFVGIGVLEKVRFGSSKHVHVLVEVEELAAFEGALAGFPFSGAYTEGNAFAFQAGGIEFTLENLLPRAFDQRRAGLSVARGIAFAHDALSYDPSTKKLSDPLNAAKGDVLRSVNRTQGGIAALEVILRGFVEAEQLGLRLGADFVRWQNRTLRYAGRTRDLPAMAAAFIRKLAMVADTVSPETIKELLRSRVVSTALASALSIDVEVAIPIFDEKRASSSGEISNGAVWLAALLNVNISADAEPNDVLAWLRQGTRFDVLRSRKALSQARELLA
jgi:hypothetical protein